MPPAGDDRMLTSGIRIRSPGPQSTHTRPQSAGHSTKDRKGICTMKRIIIATAVLAAFSGTAFAESLRQAVHHRAQNEVDDARGDREDRQRPRLRSRQVEDEGYLRRDLRARHRRQAHRILHRSSDWQSCRHRLEGSIEEGLKPMTQYRASRMTAGGLAPPATVKVWDLVRPSLPLEPRRAFRRCISDRRRDRMAASGAGYASPGSWCLRIVWGFIGPRHARFADFVKGSAHGCSVSQAERAPRSAPRHLGHNPAGGHHDPSPVGDPCSGCRSRAS